MRRLSALVIGNAAYISGGKLSNPTNDAEDIALQLESSGFSVIKELNCTFAEMDKALKQFKKSLTGNDVGLFFFAGHGLQIDGENYLVAIDTDMAGEDETKYSSLPLNRIIEVMEKSPTATNIVILDACRDNPFERAWNRSTSSRGLAPVYAPRGTLIAYATSPGQLASDGKGRNGAYTSALLQHMHTPDCSIESMFKRVRNTLSASTKGKQVSWEHTSLAGEFFFNLSLGTRIDVYEKTALSDSLFVVDDGKTSHQVIRALKSLTWPVQNPAVEGFTATGANKASVNSLFVVGRNIYQAACGASKAANSYIENFLSRTSGMAQEKRKALLDGMLFEVFFDPKANLRKEFKLLKFQQLFALQQHNELSTSFEFIAECLLPDIGRFYVLPGKSHQTVIDVATRNATSLNDNILEAVHLGGENVLWLEDQDYAPQPGEQVPYEKLSLSMFEDRVAEQLVVPRHLLTIKYQALSKRAGQTIRFPYGWTVRHKFDNR